MIMHGRIHQCKPGPHRDQMKLHCLLFWSKSDPEQILKIGFVSLPRYDLVCSAKE